MSNSQLPTNLTRSNSVSSFTSDQLEEDEDSCDTVQFDTAPFDITGYHEGTGTIIIAKEGAKLPLTTNYYKSADGKLAIKFHITDLLEVSIACEKELKKKSREKILFSQEVLVTTTSTSTEVGNGDSLVTVGGIKVGECPSQINFTSNDVEVRNNQEITGAIEQPAKTKQFRSLAEFLTNVDKDFDVLVIGGLESGLRNSVMAKLQSINALTPRENISIIHALNQVYYNEYGNKRPDPKTCQKMSEILKGKFPETFKVHKTVKTTFGALNIKKAWGEGGNSDLAKRIGDNFYNKFCKKDVKKPLPLHHGSKSSEIEECSSPRGQKRFKKSYGIAAETWNYDLNASKAEKVKAKALFNKLDEIESFEDKANQVKQARAFIQELFRSKEPSQSVNDLQGFWNAGPTILSQWFEWLVNGSNDGDLSVSVELQLTKVLNIVEQYLVSKKGSEFEIDLQNIKQQYENKTGNDILYKIFLIRDLGRLFKAMSEKLIFIDGEDNLSNGANETEPNILVVKKNNFGMDDYEEKVDICLRVGTKIIHQNVSLTQALAGCIQLYFCFNIYYPAEADCLFQFVQRILCNFGDQDGARNKKGVVRKGFRDFEVS